MAEKLTKERFEQMAAFEQVFRAQMKLNPLDAEAYKGTMLVAAAAGRQLALSQEDVVGLLTEAWDQWTQYQTVKAALLKRVKK